MRTVIAMAMVLAACGTAAPTVTSAPPTTIPPSTTMRPAAVEQLPLCQTAPYVLTDLPEGFDAAATDPNAVERDVHTSVPGTWSAVWAGSAGAPVMALIRGTLPAENWVGTTERVLVAGRQAALGPLPDGVWGVAWFESEARCDLYTLLIYPPGTRDDARRVAESIERR